MTPSRDHLALHRALVTDHVRVDRYRRAIEATVRPGAVVLDLGAGTGILTVLACRAGAARVYAVEASDAIDLARRVCRANGTETLGNFGVDEGLLGLTLDARARLLRPGGAVIPAASSSSSCRWRPRPSTRAVSTSGRARCTA